ncbi:hypothetical protein Tco_0927243 [Tanacetum coccineum]
MCVKVRAIYSQLVKLLVSPALLSNLSISSLESLNHWIMIHSRWIICRHLRIAKLSFFDCDSLCYLETKTITFLLSLWDKPMSFTQDKFISAIGLPICRDTIPLPPKETVRAGLATLGLFDKDKPTLSSIILVNSSPLKMNNDLTLVKPHTITAASFQKPLASEVTLTSHMLKVAKLSEEPEQSLLPPSGEVNADDTADKSLSRASVQPVIQSKTTTDLKTKKKKIPPSSIPKSPYKVRVILSKKQATANATKSLEASKLAEEQGN